MLLGRDDERRRLETLLADAAEGAGQALVVRGDPGVGKTALLDHLVARADRFRVVHVVGIEAEMELAFAALHQLCAPLLDRAERLPGPQRAALETAFGLGEGGPPNPFLIGLATLSLLAEAAEDEPLLCVADDAQWFDEASAGVLAFVARRLGAECAALVFATRASGALAGLPELVVEGLPDADAGALLEATVAGPLDEAVRAQLLAETAGNPLALLELPRGLSPSDLAGGFGLPHALPLTGRIEGSFRRRIERLPTATRRLALLAAADPTGDPILLEAAADRLGLAPSDAEPLVHAELLEFTPWARFRHPLVRSAVYRAAPLAERQRAHLALADATDPDVDPDRRAWHRARATAAPDESVAAELDRSAGRALAAAEAMVRAGDLTAAPALLTTARSGPLDERHGAQADLLAGQIALALCAGDASLLLVRAAERLEPLDPRAAWATYRDAFYAALTSGRLTAAGGGVLDVAAAARRLSAPTGPERLVHGLALLLTEGHAAGAPLLQAALRDLRDQEDEPEAALPWLPLACRVAHDVWDDESWDVLSARMVDQAREVGALDLLPFALNSRLAILLRRGEFTLAAVLADEARHVDELTGRGVAPYGDLVLAAWEGREADARQVLEASTDTMVRRGVGQWLTAADWAMAVLLNGLGRFDEALVVAERAVAHSGELGLADWSLAELIEAACRSGAAAAARAAMRRLEQITSACGGDWALGLAARCRAVIGDGPVEDHYRESIERLGRTVERFELARARLLYGEWLRRERRRLDAREQLRAAEHALRGMGGNGFADRAARELLATGEAARRRSDETRDQLTAQEAQIARLARDGLANREIATQLFISPRTVEYHLHKVFAKLDIRSRTQLELVAIDGD